MQTGGISGSLLIVTSHLVLLFEWITPRPSSCNAIITTPGRETHQLWMHPYYIHIFSSKLYIYSAEFSFIHYITRSIVIAVLCQCILNYSFYLFRVLFILFAASVSRFSAVCVEFHRKALFWFRFALEKKKYFFSESTFMGSGWEG